VNTIRLLIVLLACFAMIPCACSKDDKKKEGGAAAVSQQHAGTLAVKILPEAPVSTDDLQAQCTCGEGVTYTWEKNGQPLDLGNAAVLPRSRFVKRDRITVSARLGSETGSTTVVIGDAPPRVTSVTFLPENICRGVDITAAPAASDPDGDEVSFSYKWSVNGQELTENTPVLKGDRFKKGDRVSLTVVPSDGEVDGPAYATASITIPGAAPVFVSTPPADFSGRTYTYQASAKDPDGGPVTYSLSSAPAGMTIESLTGKLVWQIPAGAEGTHTIRIVARTSDGGQGEQTYTLTIRMNGGDSK